MAAPFSKTKTDYNVDFGMAGRKPKKLLFEQAAKMAGMKSGSEWLRRVADQELERLGLLSGDGS